ncbi:DNA-binding protein [Hallella sp.]|uniref:DNA-binding protein n=1 Tax=Hallella sp. TaxID=2980186 RepID=UPI0030790D9F
MAKATKSFVLRLDSATMQAVEKWAVDEFRSTNGQLQWIVADALRRNRRLPKHAPASRQGDKLEESAETQTQH